ncbi:hypothetical protein [Actinomadura roseirufa]|uniref:hypothetical protein n=1 Tax=Actinomadura roseirufa TaxID=2094049 RepID=UPI0010412B4D|nr:hypothetical protein [Actinomadura roseirufa]
MTDRTYAELLSDLDEFARDLDSREQANRLYGLFAPLLDRVEQWDEELTDEPMMSTPEAVRAIRRAAAGQPVDADAVHERLCLVGFVEDQDVDLHVMGQTAVVAAQWLSLLVGRDLRTILVPDEEPLPPYAPSRFTRIVDLLAWTRSNQSYWCWEDADAYAEFADYPAATHELTTMHQQITA